MKTIIDGFTPARPWRRRRSYLPPLCGAILIAFGLAGCASQPAVSPFPDLSRTPTAPTAVMSVYEKDATIEEMKQQARRNAEKAGL